MRIRRCLAVALLSCTGCFHLPRVPIEQPALPAPVATPALPVTPDQVTRGNAHQMVETLRQELDRASNE